MIYEEIPVQVDGSEPYARLQCYIWSWSEEIDIDDRPLILVIPGGGYHLTTDRESEPVALHFMARGYHVAVLRYSVAPTGWPVSLHEVTRALQILDARAREWHIDSSKFILMGFSAGGHLAASYAVYWQKEQEPNASQEEGLEQQGRNTSHQEGQEHSGKNKRQKEDKEQERRNETRIENQTRKKRMENKEGAGKVVVRPAGLILGYPVISSNPAIWHEGSFRQLLGKRFEDQALREEVSLEKHVNDSVPPVFIWNTKTDDTVPAANSEVFVQALRKQGIPVEYHEYPTGGHGLSLANGLSDNRQHWCTWAPCQDWVDLAEDWLERAGLGVETV